MTSNRLSIICSGIFVALSLQFTFTFTAEVSKICEDVGTCRIYCEYGFKKDERGCPLCECDPGICSEVQCPEGKVCKGFELDYSGHRIAECIDPTLPPKCWGIADNGIGFGAETRYFYNSEKDECEPFQYKGMGGNENRFETLEKCLGTCIKGLCSPLQCQIDCGSQGFKEDKKGCMICECNELPSSPAPVDQGGACKDIMCSMYCEFGMVKDENGCQLCQCRQAPQSKLFRPSVNCLVQECLMRCELGFQERDGCPVCECKEPKASVCPEVMCAMYCEYGFQRGENGCEICTCSRDPCTYTKCPPEKSKCKSVPKLNGRWEPKCLSEKAIGRTWCSPLECMMECENGFTNDKYGCHICECREQQKLECRVEKCISKCNYGYKFDSNGCRTCECLSDPCLTKVCSRLEVCEAFRDEDTKYNTEIPAMPRCIPHGEVKRLEVGLTYEHGLDSNDVAGRAKEIEEGLKGSIGRMMYIDDEYIRGISVRSVGEKKCEIVFNLISYGQLNLVNVLETLREKLTVPLDSSFKLDGSLFNPLRESIKAHFFSDPEVTVESVTPTTPEQNTNTMFIIIGCTFGGLVVIACVIGIIVVIIKTKRRHQDVRKKIAYSKVQRVPSNARQSRPTSEAPRQSRPTSEAPKV